MKLKQGKYNSYMFISTWSSLKLPVHQELAGNLDLGSNEI